MKSIEKDKNTAEEIARLIQLEGGRAYYVGGCVRDGLLNRDNKDLDIEVHGISPAALERILDSLGSRISLGESFGIYKLKGCDVDIAMPRKEKLRGKGHKDFDIFVDPFAGTESACRRRDFTVNAMMRDVLSGEITDHFGGISDLEKKILRHVNDESFTEDPLRVLRAAQFAARFDFTVAPETVELCRGMELGNLSRERVLGELEKALLKAGRPSLFFSTLRFMGQLHCWFPELEELIGIGQDRRYHAEGDVWEHTMLVLDEAAKLRHKACKPLAFMLAALCHDMGKARCKDGDDDHAVAGIAVAESFLCRLTKETRLIKNVLNLVAMHMRPLELMYCQAGSESYNIMFDKVHDPDALLLLVLADDSGRVSTVPSAMDISLLYRQLEEYRECMARPCVTGQDLLDAGLRPGRDFTDILSFAHSLHLAGADKKEAMEKTLEYAKTHRN